MNIKNKKLLDISLILLLVILLFIILILLINILTLGNSDNNKSNSLNENDKNTSYSQDISYPKVNEMETQSKEIHFTLDTLDLGVPQPDKKKVSIDSLLSGQYSLDNNQGHAIIKSDNFDIFIFLGLGETGGLKTSMRLEDTFTNTQLNKSIYKVNTSKEHLYYAGDSFNNQFNNYYFYSDSFKSCNIQGDQYDNCENQEIEIDKISRIGIYCATVNEASSKYCDEFVKNLIIEVK